MIDIQQLLNNGGLFAWVILCQGLGAIIAVISAVVIVILNSDRNCRTKLALFVSGLALFLAGTTLLTGLLGTILGKSSVAEAVAFYPFDKAQMFLAQGIGLSFIPLKMAVLMGLVPFFVALLCVLKVALFQKSVSIQNIDNRFNIKMASMPVVVSVLAVLLLDFLDDSLSLKTVLFARSLPLEFITVLSIIGSVIGVAVLCKKAAVGKVVPVSAFMVMAAIPGLVAMQDALITSVDILQGLSYSSSEANLELVALGILRSHGIFLLGSYCSTVLLLTSAIVLLLVYKKHGIIIPVNQPVFLSLFCAIPFLALAGVLLAAGGGWAGLPLIVAFVILCCLYFASQYSSKKNTGIGDTILLGGLAFIFATVFTTNNIVIQIFNSLEVIPPTERPQALFDAAKMSQGIMLIGRNSFWPFLLSILLIVLLFKKNKLLDKSKSLSIVVGCAVCLLVYGLIVTVPALLAIDEGLYEAAGPTPVPEQLQLPTIGDGSPGIQAVTPKPFAIVGLDNIYMGPKNLGSHKEPSVLEVFSKHVGAHLAKEKTQFVDAPIHQKSLLLGVDDRLPFSRFSEILTIVKNLKASHVYILGYPGPTQKVAVAPIFKLSPLMGYAVPLFYGNVNRQQIILTLPPSEEESRRVLQGVLGGSDLITFDALHGGKTASGVVVQIPEQVNIEFVTKLKKQTEKRNMGWAILRGERQITAGRYIFGCAVLDAKGYRPIFSKSP